MSLAHLRDAIRPVPDFPRPGIVFQDITPILSDPTLFRIAVEGMADQVRPVEADALLAIESRGFLFGAALAAALHLPLHLARKPGKLPRDTLSADYELEYGSDRIETHRDGITPGGRYLVVDDVVATGGTAAAAATLIRTGQGMPVGLSVLIEIAALDGRRRLDGLPVNALLSL